MKIGVKAEISTEVYKKNKSHIKTNLRNNLCNELVKHEIFIEPPTSYRDGKTEIEMHFFALSYTDIDRLEKLSEKYQEIKGILRYIIINK